MSHLGMRNTSRAKRGKNRPKGPAGKLKAKILLTKAPLKRRRSLKSKHRFSEKHQGKGFKVTGMTKSKRTILESVNPNLNASREARRRHMQQVSLEVALLKEEWRLYKEEAERALEEMQKAKKEKTERRNKLASLKGQQVVGKAGRERAKLIKRISKLEKIIKYKSDVYNEFSQKMEQNERKRKQISLRFKDTFIQSEGESENDTQPLALAVRGKHRNIRRSSSIRMRESKTISNFFTDIETENDIGNESLSDSDDELQEQGPKEGVFDIMPLCGSQYEEREDIVVKTSDIESVPPNEGFNDDLVESRAIHSEDAHKNLTETKLSSHETAETGTKYEENEHIVIQKTQEIDQKQHNREFDDRPLNTSGESQMYESTHNNDEGASEDRLEDKSSADVGTIPDNELEEVEGDLDDNLMESRNVPDEVSSQRIVCDNSECSNDAGKEKPNEESISIINPPKEFRLKGDFGDDFEVSALTNLFRGGWHRAPTQEHLSRDASLE